MDVEPSCPAVALSSLPTVRAINHAVDVSPAHLAARTGYYLHRLTAEMQPSSALQTILVEQLARHAAGAELGSATEAATLKFAAQNGASLDLFNTERPVEAGLLATAGNELVARAARYRAQHERAFFAALRSLSTAFSVAENPSAVDLFVDEDACARYLHDWQLQQPWCCPQCDSTQRYSLRLRARFECSCGRQFSEREGTVFAGSHVSLLAWFRLATALVADPHTGLQVLSKTIAVVRRATVRRMAKRVLDALASNDADQQLAGLPQRVYSHLLKVSPRQSFEAHRLATEARRKNTHTSQSFSEESIQGGETSVAAMKWPAPA
jgi:transposase-like protein